MACNFGSIAMLPKFTTASLQSRVSTAHVVKRRDESHRMNMQNDAQGRKTSLRAGLTAAIMLVGFCFTIALVMSGSASIVVDQKLQATDR